MTSPSPASVPTEEDVARLLFERGRGVHDVPSFEEATAEMREWLLGHARAVLDLFAPILAEKERKRFAGLMTGQDPAEVWKAQAHKMADVADAAEARALAAEAALAAERERCIAIVDAQVPDWVKERSGPYWEGYRDAMEDAAEDMRKGSPP